MSQSPPPPGESPDRIPDEPRDDERHDAPWAPAGGQPPQYGQQVPPPQYGQQVPPPQYGQQVPPPQYGQQAPPQYGQHAPPVALQAPPVSVGEAFRYAWQGFKVNAGPWVLAALVMLVVSSTGTSIERTIRNAGAPSGDAGWVMMTFDPAASLVNIIFTIINFAIGAALVSAALRTVDGRRIQVGDFLSVPNFLQALLAAVLLSLAMFVGILLLVIPGLIIGVLGMFYLHFAIDRRLSAVDALRASFVLVKDNLGTAVLFILAALGVVILGALALVVGLLVAFPLVVIASAFVYRRLTGGVVMVPGSAG
ncbi:hypothetical protein [Georgenia muralis]|uniref:Putative membrane protein n=1 Tax=Georgenia muralis TaxID=154117 RepID=A0A3N4Z9Q0_9MICO|nr:hypothetical protein [Georgenia muralis]RPF28784.1 putative membrane protein [Georgenia muralis]